MPTSPFLSGRIPQDLYNKVEEHCKETGKGKTDLLIEALSTYLNFPVKTQTTNFVPQPAEVTKEMFELLQMQVNKLEHLITQSQLNVITQHDDHSEDMTTSFDNNVINNDNQCNDPTSLIDNNIYQDDNLADKNSAKVEVTVIENDNDDNSDEKKKDADDKVEVITNDNNTDNKEENVSAIIINDNNSDNNKENESQLDFNEITDSKLAELIRKTKKQIIGLRGSKTRQLKKGGIEINPGDKLENPNLLEIKEPIIIEDKFYKLYFLGINLQKEGLWNLVFNSHKLS